MTDQIFLQEAERLIDNLLNIIEAEQEAILKSEPEAIDRTMTAKSDLLDKIAALEPRLSALIKVSDDVSGLSTIVESIKAKLQECRNKNKENRLLTVQGLNVVDKSISFFESLMQIGSARVYDSEGNSKGRTMKRNIGMA